MPAMLSGLLCIVFQMGEHFVQPIENWTGREHLFARQIAHIVTIRANQDGYTFARRIIAET
jgi:hypothetical protein